MTLAIHLFGQPKLLVDSVLYPFNAPPKTLPLLAYLLLHRQQMLTRQQVAFALWPDDSETAARANLRRHLHQLQHTLPPAPPERPWLLGDARTVGWNPQAGAWIDVAEFERLAAASETQAEAVQLYTGELIETVYDDWVFFERERLLNLLFTCLGELVYFHRTRRDYPAAIGFAQQILGRDPFREDVIRQLISLRYESGDRAGAIQEYETFEHRLRQEMGVSPMPETQALHESVLRNARLPGSAASTEPVLTSKQPFAAPSLPFVGRTAELDYLSSCWNRAARGRGGLVLIGGEAGVGKTRLARELALFAEQQGGRVLYGGTTPGDLHPYQAMVEILQAALPLLAALESVPRHLAALSALVPELKARRGLPALPPLDPERERIRLFDAAATCLEKLADPRPLLVVLEDWHWAGEASVALLEFIARRAVGCPLLLIATYRDEETPRIHPLRSLRRRLQSENLVVHLPLSRLSAQAVEALASQIGAPGSQLAARLYTESEGNPLFIEMLWQAWQAGGDNRSTEAPLLGSGFSGGVRAAIVHRLERLSAPARAYAGVAAVLGPAFDVEAARDVGGWDEARAYEALKELLDCRLVREAEGRSRFDYVFAHHLIQAELYAEIPPAKCKRRHRRAAEVLEDLYPDRLSDLAGELAHHYDLGSSPAQAVLYYLAAARQHLAVFADTEALSVIGRALTLAAETPSRAPSRTLVDLLLLREGIHYRRGERPEQHADLQRLEALAVEDPELHCEVLKRRILYHKRSDEHALQKEFVEAFKAQAHALGSRRWQAEAIFAEANYLKVTRGFSQAVLLLQEALSLYQELGDCQNQVHCCCLLAEIFIIQRQSLEAEAWTQRALSLCDQQGPSYQLMNTLWNMSANGLINRDLERCLLYGQKLLASAEQANDRNWQAGAHRLIGMAYQRQSRIAEAYQSLNTALELYNLNQKPKGTSLTLQTLGHVKLSVGDYAAARQLYQQSFDITQQLNDIDGMASEAINLSCAASFQEDFLAERAYAQRALQLTRQIENHFLEAMALQNLGEAEGETGDLPAARQHLAESLALLADPALVNERASVLADLALAYWKAGDLSLAQKTAADVLALYPQVDGTDDNVHRYLWAAARVLRAAGQAERASQAVEQAYQAFQRDLSAIPGAELRSTFANIRHNRQIAAAYERGEWP